MALEHSLYVLVTTTLLLFCGLVMTSDNYVNAEWCKIYSTEDARTHLINARALEPEDSEVLKSSDLFKGNTLLWNLKGKRYDVMLLEIYGKGY